MKVKLSVLACWFDVSIFIIYYNAEADLGLAFIEKIFALTCIGFKPI